MKIIIVNEHDLAGSYYRAYKDSLLSFLGFFCFFNIIDSTGANSREECIERVYKCVKAQKEVYRKIVDRLEI